MTSQTRDKRIAILRERALGRHDKGLSPESILFLLKTDIVQLGVSRTTAKDYYDTVVGQISK